MSMGRSGVPKQDVSNPEILIDRRSNPRKLQSVRQDVNERGGRESLPPLFDHTVPRLCAFLLYLKLHGMQCRIGAHSEVQIVGSGCQPGSLQLKDVNVSAKPECVIGNCIA